MITRMFSRLIYCLVLLAPFSARANEVDPMDWPNWRGPEQNGVSREKGLVDTWSLDGENLLWSRPEYGTRSTPICMRGKLYFLHRRDPGTKTEGEQVVCLDAATGEMIWENKFNAFLTDVPDTRVGWSSVVGDPETGNIFALGICGYFQCIDGETGKTLWARSLSEEFGLISTYGGRTNIPVVFDDMAIISAVFVNWGEVNKQIDQSLEVDKMIGGRKDMAKPAHRFLALDKTTGDVRWFSGTRLLPEDTTYSTPALTVLNGQAALVVGSGDGSVVAYQPRTGKIIWRYLLSRRGLNTPPLVADGKIYTGHSEENRDDSTMGALVALDGSLTGDITATGELWRVKERLMVGRSAPIMYEGRIFAIDDSAGMYFVDPATGEEVAKKFKIGTVMHSSPLFADGKIYCSDTNGRVHILQPNEKGVKVLSKLRLPQGEEVYAAPIASHGRVYFTTTGGIYCLGSKDQQPAIGEIPAAPVETPAGENDPVAIVQVVPAEVLLAPGEKQIFNVKLFNANGQLLKEQPAEFTVEGAGQITAEGEFTAESVPQHSAAYMMAKVGEQVGTARVRIVPDLTWKFDFNDGVIPVTWVAARYRHVGIDYDLFKSLEEKDPVASQMYLYLTTQFTSLGRPALKFDETPPQLTLAAFRKFLGFTSKLENRKAAETELNSHLDALVEARVLAKYQWSVDQKAGITLNADKGDRKIEGNGVMLKVTTIPKGTRSQCWMGPTTFHDYTIQADVQGANKKNKLPDIGLIAQRYTLDMMGASQQLQIRTWTPQLERFSKTVPFEWKPGVWYTLKLKASIEDGKAVLRGKAWERDKPEPEGWLVEATDEMGNFNGSPGLFGNANDSEIFIDNIEVSPNQ